MDGHEDHDELLDRLAFDDYHELLDSDPEFADLIARLHRLPLAYQRVFFLLASEIRYQQLEGWLREQLSTLEEGS